MAQTKINIRFLPDAAITDAHVSPSAAIATSKLADGANFIKRDGSVAMTGALNLGSQSITNLATPSAGTDAANKSYVDSQIASVQNLFDHKDSVRVATTTNGTLATAFANGQTVDGVVLATGNRILIKNQTTQSENGIYIVQASGAPVRSEDANTWNELYSAFLAVEEGTTNQDTLWLNTNNSGGTLGTTNVTFQQIGNSAGLLNSNFVDKEIPSGAINGSNTAFVLANTPVAGSEHIYVDGVLMEAGAGNDYTISGVNITMLFALQTGEKIRASYRK